jgi:hypothetical protein
MGHIRMYDLCSSYYHDRGDGYLNKVPGQRCLSFRSGPSWGKKKSSLIGFWVNIRDTLFLYWHITQQLSRIHLSRYFLFVSDSSINQPKIPAHQNPLGPLCQFVALIQRLPVDLWARKLFPPPYPQQRNNGEDTY